MCTTNALLSAHACFASPDTTHPTRHPAGLRVTPELLAPHEATLTERQYALDSPHDATFTVY